MRAVGDDDAESLNYVDGESASDFDGDMVMRSGDTRRPLTKTGMRTMKRRWS